ncbi:MAG: permease [Microcystis wesenbergii Mw_MB_S_20031200_S109]|uniref:Permease n=1 Tax=Microcystis wesenbergii Mw_MB_S_20031200_S109D TaxID=2486241 RepID=A0A552MBL3_9CHRO|nr:MAG: permease [Microcystis wesenbergii Mw_MB_S_20031200_S109]TRV29840.1 MAG: permease [Microcystis wesenbergii Mw_MB_S_20031200_S109D]
MFDPFYPFDWLATQLVTRIFGLSLDYSLGSSLHFFFYDVPKVLTLLLTISFFVGTLQSFLEPSKVRNFLAGKFSFLGNILAGCIGVITPFCSCSAVPLFIGFLEAGVPLGVTFSYLISAPMVNEVAVILLWGLFGFRVTLLYIGFGLILAITSGYIIGQLKLEKWVEPFVWELQKSYQPQEEEEEISLTWKQRFQQGQYQAVEIFKSVWLYVVIGIAVGAVIHGYVPADFIADWAGKNNPFAVPLAVVMGVPLYANIAGVLPITEALVSKGIPLGTVLAFTMAVTALSLPEMIILRKVLKIPLLTVFISLVTVGIIGVGYLFNLLGI